MTISLMLMSCLGVLGGAGGFGHVGVVVDGSEDVHDGPGVVVGFYFHFGFCGGKGLRSDGSVGVEEFLYDLMNRSFKESGFIVN